MTTYNIAIMVFTAERPAGLLWLTKCPSQSSDVHALECRTFTPRRLTRTRVWCQGL